MGVSKDIMHDFALQEIKRLYSTYDGWTIVSCSRMQNYDTIYQMDRTNGGHRQIARVFVTYRHDIDPAMLDQLKKATRCSDGTVARYEYAVLAPANADLAAVPADVRKHTIQSFSFDGDALTWVKKPVRKTDKSPASGMTPAV